MTIQLDHVTVASRDKAAAAERLAQLLGVRWGAARVGPFCEVYVSDDLTIDFDQWTEPFPAQHLCFRVAEADFDAILARLQHIGVAYRSLPHGPDDGQVNTSVGGRIVYWREPDDHVWEMLTVSYARAIG
ncbi:MAG: VOC family protein [Steroidobacteraceae bacterium]